MAGGLEAVSAAARRREVLRGLGERIERVSGAGRAKLLYRVAAPVFGALGWKPKLSVAAVRALVGGFAREEAPTEARLGPALKGAIAELEENVVNVERLAALGKRPPVAHASWLRRTYELLVRADGALEPVDASEGDELADLVATTPQVSLALPLAPITPAKESDDDAAESRERIVMLELAAVDHLLEAARGEREILARRRRLFEAARQVLLDASAAIALDGEAVSDRKDAILKEIMRLDRFEGAGVDFEVGLVHQARAAVTRGEQGRLRAVVAALDHVSRSSGDLSLRRFSRRATHEVFGDARAISEEQRRASLERSVEERLGIDVCARVKSAYDSGRLARYNAPDARSDVTIAGRKYLGEGCEAELLAASLAIDGAFELGGTLSPVRVVAEHRSFRRVPYPAPTLALVAAEAVEDLPDAVIEDPRLLVLQLATGRLLSRRYVLEEVKRTSKVVMTSEVRVFLLDGSGSMLGPRARVRDAMIVSELATLERRLGLAQNARCAVYYGFFTEEVGPIVKVSTAKQVERSISEICSDVKVGGTDIEKALLAAFDVVAKARATDKDLTKAQVVLVTDGEAAVDEATVVAAREMASGDVPLGVSVVALGTENPALRGLVARQRAKGERAFYHHIDDATLSAMVSGELDAGLPLHLPDTPGDALAIKAALDRSLGHVVTELEDLTRARDLEALDRMDEERQALREVGLEVETVAGEGERARMESLQKDHASLGRRFERWFPRPGTTPDVPEELDEGHAADADAVHVMLSSIVEVVRVVGGSELSRKADAIDLVERLLPDAHLTPARYFATLGRNGARLAPALAALHAEVTPNLRPSGDAGPGTPASPSPAAAPSLASRK